MKIAIEHSTAWHTADNAGVSTQLLRLTPRGSSRQQVLSWDLSLPGHASRAVDPFGNVQHVLTVEGDDQDVTLTARGVVEIRSQQDEDDDGLTPLLFLRATTLTQPDSALLDFADNFRVANPSRDVLRALMVAVGSEMKLLAGAYAGRPAAAAFTAGEGTCHDQSHAFIACARLLGVPARYVSGYVHGGDSIASHAWTEAFVHGRWHTFDVAHRVDRLTTHLKLAIGMDYLDACPVRGVRFAGTLEKLTGEALADQARQANQ